MPRTPFQPRVRGTAPAFGNLTFGARTFGALAFGALTLGFALTATAAQADIAGRGPTLGAASNFGQHWQPKMMDAAKALGVRNFRDAVYWSEVEKGGKFAFDTPDTGWPGHLGPDAATSLTFNNGHPGYDDGKTPYTPGALAAFGHDAAETVLHFPRVTAVEVGNEMNAANFVSGKVKDDGLEKRPEHYLALLKATYTAVKAARPEVAVLGGALHSIPVGYVRKLFALGAAKYMDALAFHPYTTAPEQLARQIAVLRGVPGLETMPLEATEFGDPNPDTAAGTLLRYYCQMSLSGVSRAVWYPLNPRGDGLTPLIGPDLKPTAVGETYATIARLMEHRAATDASPDPFTYACHFDPDTLVIWGAPRSLTPAAGQTALGPGGRKLLGPIRLSRDTPVILTGPGTPDLGPQMVLADSFDQFSYSRGRVHDGFDRYVLDRGRRVPLVLMPGQDKSGRPWTPYLAEKDNPDVRLQPDTLLPGGTAARPIEIVQDWRAPSKMKVVAEVSLMPAARSADGVTLRVALNGKTLTRSDVNTPEKWQSAPLSVAPGAVLSIVVGPGKTAKGDVTHYRITIRRAE
ncbi:hypothetical protein [Acidimangrovimonas sediminis]|uniref:hypothetical protein n=1 Tax=Acidimangrovimonas sediminis TaxID=2056283 RepID=UPI000C7FBC71|nr:hypothetical protein [Acidimangrovimonas sediminis]